MTTVINTSLRLSYSCLLHSYIPALQATKTLSYTMASIFLDLGLTNKFLAQNALAGDKKYV